MNIISQNKGKIFESDFKKSVPETCWVYRLRDNAASFADGSKTRFTSKNICDFIMFDDISQTLFLFELKSTQGTSIPFSMIRDNQYKDLLKASDHNLIAGLICNFRNDDNDTLFIDIKNFRDLKKNINKKSFNIKDLNEYGAIQIDTNIIKVHYSYDIHKLIDNLVGKERKE